VSTTLAWPIVDLQRRIELANNYSELANTANKANKSKTIVTQKCIQQQQQQQNTLQQQSQQQPEQEQCFFFSKEASAVGTANTARLKCTGFAGGRHALLESRSVAVCPIQSSP
jgi:hypothetical protein